MQALSRLIRDSYYQRRIEDLAEDELDESLRLAEEVDQAWIDQKDREWQRQRERRQRLEYLRSEPADARDVAAAQRFLAGCSARLTEAEVVDRWKAAYDTQRQHLQQQAQRLQRLYEKMDPSLDEHRRCYEFMEKIRSHLDELAHQVKYSHVK